ncbi:Ku protein [Streptomyces sp. NPDC016309]|uniref:non-homologous end joining protein Ku n=1 Tax=Streptomyces sp. NPDC016309 TaxID=3364965 RepID=UPI0036F9B8A9
MPRPVWSGAISFGLVTIPIKVLPATESHNISFHQVHETDGGRIRYQKVCTLDDKVLSQDEIGRGYEIAKDKVIPITDAELDAMPLPTAKAIEIVAFVPASSIDPIRIGDSYYLAADGVAAKPYKLLRSALERSDRVAIAKFAWHNRERLGLLQVLEGDVIALHAMRWPDEIRDASAVAPPATDVDDSEVEGAVALIDAMTTEDLTQFRDEYRTALEELLHAKAEHREPQPVGAAPEEAGGEVVDLMAALNASVEQARASRADGGEDATVHEMPQPKKKTAAKKTAAKKTTATKAPARKSRKAG